MAGMIQEQTKQQISGLPGLMQIPVLGTLFKSRDYVNRQTELMVIVTPYIARAVAQKDLSRPDDGFADPSDPAAILLGRLNKIYGAPGKRCSGAGLPRQIRLHSRLTDATRTRSMKKPLTRRARCWLSPASPPCLAGCKTTSQVEVVRQHSGRLSPAPSDRGAREGADADRVHRRRAAARSRQRSAPRSARSPRAGGSEATGGIVIEVPVGAPNERAAASASREIRAILSAGGRARSFDRDPALSRTGPGAARHDPRQLSAMAAETGPCGLWPRRHRPDLRSDLLGEPAALEPRLRQSAQSRRAGRRTRPISCSRAAKRRCLPRAARPSLDKYRKGEPTATQYPDANKGKISDVGQ